MKKEYDFSKGRRGAVVEQKGKTRITIYIDDDVLEEFRERADEAGSGYQTMMNQALREYLGRSRILGQVENTWAGREHPLTRTHSAA